ncbi:hypothetical protein GL213_14440 [Halogeometricum borinquense]|uniref:Uncharacterized protein n=1 Tax=Halogeometricum borinquense TaxID=60847 RepID=A0A6C0UJK9_9EURY|nr:hypothetical protein [Halogeometricum borinquense]QIB75724.1 hypothetical protein G3I44_16405 [Halogeometricum borinquense]QIQ77612.1 hypothetical protein GL213_14440 [Halogeometricum borinquense]
MEVHGTPHAGQVRRSNNSEQIDDHVLDAEIEAEGLSSEQRAGLVAAGQAAIINGVNDVRERLEGGIEDVRTAAEIQQEMADLYAERRWDEVDAELSIGERLGEDSQVYAAIEATFTRMVSASVTLIVGIYVFAQISSTMPTPSNPELANATSTVKGTTGNAFTLGAVAVIVLVASVILGLVGGFGGRGRGRR